VYSRDELKGSVRFVNAGTEPLRIEAVRTSCGCTAVNAERYANREYAPGEGDIIEIAFTPQTDGQNTKQVIIQSNTAAGRTVRIPVAANVVPTVRTSTQMIRMNNIEVGQPAESSLLVESRDADFEILDIKTASGRNVFAFDVDRVGEGDPDYPGQARVFIRTLDSMPTGMFNERVEITTRGTVPGALEPVVQTLSVTVRGSVPSLIESATRYMRVPTVQTGDDFTAQLVLSHVDGMPFEVVSATVTSLVLDAEAAEITITNEDGGDGSRKILVLEGTVPADTRTSRLVGEITLQFDIEGHGPMVVRFNGAVAGPRVIPTQAPAAQQGTGVGVGGGS